MCVLGRRAGTGDRPTIDLGRYRTPDGSDGAPAELDVDGPHVGFVVGKRGYGKSHTLGVLAEGAARAPGVAPVVVDPMGASTGLAADADSGVSARVVDRPQVRAGALPAPAWPDLLGLDPTGAVGGLIWLAAAECETLSGIRDRVAAADAEPSVRRAAANHLRLAASWDVFDPDGLDAAALRDGAATVLDCTGLDPTPANAVVHGVARALYAARVAGECRRLPWLLVDEAHAFFGGAAAPALRTLCTRGRAPGVSLVAATQRPGTLPDVALSQADLLLAHRLTHGPDVDALARAAPTYLEGTLRDRLPATPGEAVIVDDATESVHGVRIRDRATPHRGGGPSASATGVPADGSGPGTAGDARTDRPPDRADR